MVLFILPENKKIFPDVHILSLVFPSVPTASFPVTEHHWKEHSSIFSASSLQLFTYINYAAHPPPPTPWFLQAFKLSQLLLTVLRKVTCLSLLLFLFVCFNFCCCCLFYFLPLRYMSASCSVWYSLWLFWQYCLTDGKLPLHVPYAWSYSMPATGLWPFFGQTSWCSCQTISPACHIPSWQLLKLLESSKFP